MVITQMYLISARYDFITRYDSILGSDTCTFKYPNFVCMLATVHRVRVRIFSLRYGKDYGEDSLNCSTIPQTNNGKAFGKAIECFVRYWHKSGSIYKNISRTFTMLCLGYCETI